MEPRITLVTLAVADVARERAFYERLGWTPFFTAGEVVFFALDGLVLGLFHRDAFAQDAQVPAARLAPGGAALAHNVRSRAEVAQVFAAARAAGAEVVRAPRDTEWGGHAGYFADPEGHLWEVAWNPHWPLDAQGRLRPPQAPASG